MSFIVSNLYTAFDWVINSSLKVSILIVAIFLIRKLMKGKTSPKLNHILWLIVMLRMIIPDIYQSGFNIYKYSSSFNKDMHAIEASYGKFNQIDINSIEYIANEVDSSYSNQTNSPLKGINIKSIFFFIWFIGVSLILGITLIINLNFLSKISRGNIIRKASVIDILDKCKEDMGVSKDILIIEADQVKSVGILGFFNPRILFPEGLISKLDDDNLRYVFLHELSHLKRKDIMTNWVISILTAFHWFNPIVWYGFYKMREDSEICCDSLVMTYLRKDEAINYGYTIIKLAENLSRKSIMPVSASIAGNKSQTKRRISMIKMFSKYPYKLSVTAILIIALSVTIAFVGAKDNTNSSVISSNEVVVYTTHSNELYKNGVSAMEVGKRLREGLEKEGFNCTFIEVPMHTKRENAFPTSKELIKNNVKDYSNKVLIDVHIDYGLFDVNQTISPDVELKEGIHIFLGKDNPNFNSNNEFAKLLLEELKEKNMKHEPIILVKQGNFNQNLSSKALGIQVGTSNATKKEIDEYLTALTSSLKKVIPNLR